MADSGVGGIFHGGVALLHNQSVPSSSSQPLNAFFISGPFPSLMGSSSMVSFEDVCGGKRSERSFFRAYDQEALGNEDFDDYFRQPEKKRRLTIEQVQFLEKSFEADNKLEPERKIRLAKDLGLRPRQVAIWFQNRRARWKSKQLEKDFDTLQASYNSLKGDYENLLKEKEKLQAEVVHLTEKLHLKEKNQGDHSNSPYTYNQFKTAEQEPIIDSTSESEDPYASIFACNKQEDLSSAKSDVLDSDSTHYVDGGHNHEPGDSSYAFEADHSDISQDDDHDYLSKSLLPSSHDFPKIEDIYYPDLREDPPSLFWPYWESYPKIEQSSWKIFHKTN